MDLHENLLRGIYAYGGSLAPPCSDERCLHHQRRDDNVRGFAGFEKPSAIQQKGIVPFGKGLDVIQQAQSGTGKTATFCAGILQRLDYGELDCQALVLAPTRELAQQIEKVMRALGDYLEVSKPLRRLRCKQWLDVQRSAAQMERRQLGLITWPTRLQNLCGMFHLQRW